MSEAHVETITARLEAIAAHYGAAEAEAHRRHDSHRRKADEARPPEPAEPPKGNEHAPG